MIQIVSKKNTHKLQGTDMSSTNKGDGTYNSKKDCCMNGKKILKSLLGEKYLLGKTCSLFRIQRIMQTHGGSFSISFGTCIGQQTQLDTS